MSQVRGAERFPVPRRSVEDPRVPPRPPRKKPDFDEATLLKAAKAMRKRAHAPYSNYTVGAALLCGSGATYLGCNVENASYGLCLCAERNAIGQAVAAGEKRFVGIAIAARGPVPVPPCGMCRQVLAEFLPAEAPVVSQNERGAIARWTVGGLLPHAFDKNFL